MADNTVLNTGTGGDTISTDDIAGVKVQRVKVQHGADGSATDVSTASPLPVDQTNTTVADGGVLPAKGMQVGGTDGSVFQVLSTDNAGRVNVNVNGTVTTSGPLTDTQLRASAVPVSGPLTDTQLRASTVPVSGTVTASGPLTDTQLRASAVPVDTELPAAAALADAASNPTVPATGAFGMLWNGATWDRAPGSAAGGLTTNLKQLNGTTVATNSGAKDAGTQRIVIATDQVQLTNALKVDGSAVTQPVSGNITNAGTFAVQDSEKVADNAGFTDGTTKVNPVGFIFDEVAGIALTENDIGASRMDSKRAQVGVLEDATTRGQRAAVSAAGRLSVDASGVAVPVTDNSGSLTVDAPVGTPAFVRLSDGAAAITTLATSLATLPALTAGSAQIGTTSLTPQTSGGLSTFHLVSAASTNATSVKASAGQLYGWFIRNTSATDGKVAFHNTAGTPTAGASVFFSLNIPAGGAANVFGDVGIPFSTGIGITTVTDAADAGTTAVALSALDINLFYK
jgi:hypothetical protein